MSSSTSSSQVVVKPARFKNGSHDVAADVYYPSNFSESGDKKYGAIICAHPIGGCKEQTAGTVYAHELAKNGFIALAFDASYQGDSGGHPHFMEDPAARVEDFRCAVDYLVTLNYVDENRIGALGVCGGGGYAVTATMTDRRIKALGLVSAVNGGRMYRQVHNSADAMVTALEGIAAQRTLEARGAPIKATDLCPPTTEAAQALGLPDDDVVEGTRYYKTPLGQKPNGRTTVVDSRMAPNYVYDAFHFAELLLTQPLQIVVGAIPGLYGAYRDGVELYHRARSTNKDLFIVKGAQHFDLYWKPEAVTPALNKLVPFYKQHLLK